jgi:hypothetical protein
MSTGMLFLLFFAAFAFMGRSRNRARCGRGWSSDEDTRVELARIREMVEDLSSRFHRLEAERDFYRELVDTDHRRTGILAGEGSP